MHITNEFILFRINKPSMAMLVELHNSSKCLNRPMWTLVKMPLLLHKPVDNQPRLLLGQKTANNWVTKRSFKSVEIRVNPSWLSTKSLMPIMEPMFAPRQIHPGHSRLNFKSLMPVSLFLFSFDCVLFFIMLIKQITHFKRTTDFLRTVAFPANCLLPDQKLRNFSSVSKTIKKWKCVEKYKHLQSFFGCF